MNEIKKKTRINRAIQVISRTQEGMSVSNACKEVGIPRSTYYFIITTERDELREFLDMVIAYDRMNLLKILENKDEVLDRLIQDSLAEETKLKDKLTIYKYLMDRLEILSQRISEEKFSKEYVAEILQGPKLVHAESRSTTVDSNENY